MPIHPLTDRDYDEDEFRQSVLQALRETPREGATFSGILYRMQQRGPWDRFALISVSVIVRRLLTQLVDEGLAEACEPDAYRLRATPPSSSDEAST